MRVRSHRRPQLAPQCAYRVRAANAVLARDNHMKVHHNADGKHECSCEWVQVTVIDDAPSLSEDEIEVRYFPPSPPPPLPFLSPSLVIEGC